MGLENLRWNTGEWQKQYWRNYRKNHPDTVRAILNRYRAKNYEKIRQKQREYDQKHLKEREAKWVAKYHSDAEFRLKQLRKKTLLRNQAVAKLGALCIRCGNQDLRVLQINHKNGDGSNERNLHALYKKILDGTRPIDDLELRCANCNIIYEYERGRISDLRLMPRPEAGSL